MEDRMKRHIAHGLALALVFEACVGIVWAQTQSPSPGQAALDAAARQKRYLFILFYKQDDAATHAMKQAVDAALVSRASQATSVAVRCTDPAEKPLIDHWSLSRSPIPMVLAVAPNGAITGAFPLKLTERDVAGAIVSRGTAACLRAAQVRKLVLLCVQPPNVSELPRGVREFAADSQYGPVTEIVTLQANDPAEAGFLQTLKIKAASSTVVAFIAPPGSLLGTFDQAVTKQQFIEKLTTAQNSCCPGGKCGPGGCCPGGRCGPKP
jgi:hypothetical protein